MTLYITSLSQYLLHTSNFKKSQCKDIYSLQNSLKGKLLKIIWENVSNPNVPTPQVFFFFKSVDCKVTRISVFVYRVKENDKSRVMAT